MSTANPVASRRSRPARRNALVLALLATVSLSACGGEDEDGNQPADAPETSTPSPATDDQATSPADGPPIRITFGDTALTARLDDNATARDLAAQLPLTLTFRDHNNVEKTAIERQSQDFTVTIERG
jgi:Cyclophilin-like family